jgi:hypothetical protein
LKVHEFEKIVAKLGLKTRNSRDRLAWFEYNGQTVVRTKRSHGNKEQPGNMIRQQLKVNEKEFAGLISCSVSLDDYVNILIRRKIIAPSSPRVKPQQQVAQKPTAKT